VAEKFVSKSGAVEAELFAIESVVRHIGIVPQEISRVEMVRLTVHGGPSDSVEMTLEEFHEFFYKKIFPAVARRTCQTKQKS